jgi:tRNA nucleotidyltransferase (CCA-adding enzyme)
LRGMQFASRFNLKAAPETIELAREIKGTHAELAKERIRDEWFKWAEKSKTPSLGLRFLAETEWIDHYPELNRIRGVPQDPEWHPEGDVFTHTCHCCDALARLPAWQKADPESRIVYMITVLAHDFGKATTTHETLKEGVIRVVSPGHEDASGPLAETFLDRINAPTVIRERVVPLVVNHMAHFDTVSDRAIRRLAKRLEPENIESLLIIMTADAQGRPPRPAKVPETVRAIAKKAEELAVREKAPEPILLGRHLLERGFSPGLALGQILHRAYEAQLAGEFQDLEGAVNWVATGGLDDERKA